MVNHCYINIVRNEPTGGPPVTELKGYHDHVYLDPTVLKPAWGAGEQSATGYQRGNTGRRRQRQGQTSHRADGQIGEGLRLERITVPADLLYRAHRGPKPSPQRFH